MPPTDREENRFSARAARYARVGANVGGVAARIAGARLFGLDGQRRHECGGAGAGARRPQGPDHEGGAAPRHHPGRAAARIRRRAAEAASGGAADGLGLRQARMQAELGADWQKRFGAFEHAAGRRRLARPGAPRRGQGRIAAGLQAAISRHAVGGRSRPAAARDRCSRSTAAWTRRSTPPRSRRRSARACARSSTIEREAQARRALSPDARRT